MKKSNELEPIITMKKSNELEPIKYNSLSGEVYGYPVGDYCAIRPSAQGTQWIVEFIGRHEAIIGAAFEHEYDALKYARYASSEMADSLCEKFDRSIFDGDQRYIELINRAIEPVIYYDTIGYPITMQDISGDDLSVMVYGHIIEKNYAVRECNGSWYVDSILSGESFQFHSKVNAYGYAKRLEYYNGTIPLLDRTLIETDEEAKLYLCFDLTARLGSTGIVLGPKKELEGAHV